MKRMRSVRAGGGRGRQTVRKGLMALGALALLLGGMLVLGAGNASAEPYFSVRDGYKCSKCHVNRSGGGKRTGYAQVYMQTRMAMGAGSWGTPRTGGERDGDGEAAPGFGHGQLSDYFSVGGDLRSSLQYIHEDYDNSGNEFNGYQFDRPAACAGCHKATGGGGKRAEAYLQFAMVPGVASVVISQNFSPTTATREAYALLEQLPLDGYVKTGTFRLPTALQNTWDAPFIHGTVFQSYQGVAGWESVRGEGVEMGIEPGPFSVSFSVTNPSNLASIPQQKRVHVNGYVVGGLGLLGVAYYSDPLSQQDQRTFLSIYGGARVGRFTTLLQLDKMTEDDTASDGTFEKMAGLGEVNFLLFRGQNLKLQYEFFDPDTTSENDIRDRTSFIYEPFLTHFLQIRVGGRFRNGPLEEARTNGEDFFAEMHLFF